MTQAWAAVQGPRAQQAKGQSWQVEEGKHVTANSPADSLAEMRKQQWGLGPPQGQPVGEEEDMVGQGTFRPFNLHKGLSSDPDLDILHPGKYVFHSFPGEPGTM